MLRVHHRHRRHPLGLWGNPRHVRSANYPLAVPNEMTLGRAAKIVGVPADVLKELCDQGRLPARRGPSGHFYLELTVVPERSWVESQILEQHRVALLKAKAAASAVAKEVEAVALDVAEALEDTSVSRPLGNDLLSASSSSGALSEVLRDLRLATIDVALTHRRAKQVAAPPTAS